MADSDTASVEIRPYSGFRFSIQILADPDQDDSNTIVHQSFVRVSGVESESEVMEYMQGTDQYRSTAPGRPMFSDIELERVYQGVDDFYAWRRQIEYGAIDRRTVVIRMYALDGVTVIRTMVCDRAWPKKWVMPPMDATTSEPAIEHITLSVGEVHEE